MNHAIHIDISCVSINQMWGRKRKKRTNSDCPAAVSFAATDEGDDRKKRSNSKGKKGYLFI